MVVLSTMTSNDVGVLMGAVQWCEEGSYVKEVAARGNLPLLAKIIKGQYFNVGVPSLANPGLASTVLLLSGGKALRVAAQCVKFKEGRRVVPVGPKLAIPESYDGFFEILSEDGRAVRCMETVSELAKRFPDSCLVRESIKAFVSRSDDVETITEKSRSVLCGETLVLVGEVVGAKNGKTQLRFLRCFDQGGQNVYLPFESKGKFSAIAKEDNISGVHSIRNLLNKRLPLMVRLIHGRPPVGPKVSQFLPELRLFGAFTEEALAALPLGKDYPLLILPPAAPLKLAQAKQSEIIGKTKEFLRLNERATNLLQELSEKIHVYDTTSGNKSGGTKDPRFFRVPEPNKSRSKHSHPHRLHKVKSPSDKNAANDKQSSGTLDDYDEIDQIYDYVRGFAPLPKHIKSPYASEERVHNSSSNHGNRRISILAKLGEKTDCKPAPPPIETIPSRKGDVRSSIHEKLSPSVHPALISAVLEKAERKVEKIDKKHEKVDKKSDKVERKVEKRLRNTDENKNSLIQPLFNVSHYANLSKIATESKGSSKLFVKATQQRAAKTRVFRHKSASPVKEAILDIVNSGPVIGLNPSLSLSHVSPQGEAAADSSPSPLFKMRYKSLTNLVMDFDTIDSSTSGGKNSTDSCGSLAHRNKIPEKRSRRLPRPKSLTNLVWDGRGNSGHNDSGGHVAIGTARALLEAEKKLRLEPGVYRHARDTPALIAATSRMLSSQKKVGTLYL